jgi:hypothetical protein
MADTIDVDFEGLTQFLQALASRVNVRNSSLALLLKGVCVLLLALRIAGGELPSEIREAFPNAWVREGSVVYHKAMATGR